MAQSLVNLLAHIIFSTKNRDPFLVPDAGPRTHAYMAGVLKKWDCRVIVIGGTEDHVHILCALSKNHPPCRIVEEVKKNTTRWLKSANPAMAGFRWQNGYAMFSVSPLKTDELTDYIAKQVEHHHHRTFQEELRLFLKEYKCDYDERYVWD
jgi:putative transposase